MGYSISPVHEKMGDNLPSIKKSDEGKVLAIKNGKWTAIKNNSADNLAKVAKSGNYKDLKNKPDLSQYATNSKVEELEAQIGNIASFECELVNELPAEGESNKIYLVEKQDGPENNVCEEWLYIDGVWEMIGDTQLQLEMLSNDEIEDIWENAGIM